MTIQTETTSGRVALTFADLFHDGCDVRFVQGAGGKAKAALPDRSFLDLESVYRGRLKPSDFHFEYADRTGARTPGREG